jgi:hypothetical protein
VKLCDKNCKKIDVMFEESFARSLNSVLMAQFVQSQPIKSCILLNKSVNYLKKEVKRIELYYLIKKIENHSKTE